ncbi:MAG: hypothetical protein IPP74_11455 [Alphaproteobacteria bacterium]|nr:hypothetical protein [Alphaproteobacteria bacterium]
MKQYLIATIIVLATTAGCAELSKEDRAMLSSTNQAAQDAKKQSAQAAIEAHNAAEEARMARADADRAAEAAQKASEKSDRIFRQGQNK